MDRCRKSEISAIFELSRLVLSAFVQFSHNRSLVPSWHVLLLLPSFVVVTHSLLSSSLTVACRPGELLLLIAVAVALHTALGDDATQRSPELSIAAPIFCPTASSAQCRRPSMPSAGLYNRATAGVPLVQLPSALVHPPTHPPTLPFPAGSVSPPTAHLAHQPPPHRCRRLPVHSAHDHDLVHRLRLHLLHRLEPSLLLLLRAEKKSVRARRKKRSRVPGLHHQSAEE